MLSFLFSLTRKRARSLAVFALLLLFTGGATAYAQYRQYLPGDTVTIGEFVFDDDFQATTTAGCTVTVYDPSGSIAVNAASMTASANSWYSYSFTPAQTIGVWPTVMTCGSALNGSLVRADKTFEITNNLVSSTSVATLVNANTNTAIATASSSLAATLPTSIWNFSARTLTSFGTLVNDIWSAGTRTLTSGTSIAADIWSAATRTLTGAGLTSGSLATLSDVQSASSSVATVVNANTTSVVQNASSSVVALINANTDTRVTAASSSLGATIASASSSLASTINTNTNTVVQAASSSLGTTLASITSSITALPAAVWNVATTTMTTPGTIGYVLANNIDLAISAVSGGGGGLTAADVWAYGARTLTSAALSSGSLATNVDINNATSSVNTTVATASSSIVALVNANTNAVVQTASSSLAATIPVNVWNATTRSLTTFGTLVNDIWSAGTRTLTSGTSIAADIWSAATRTLTGAGLSSGSLATLSDVQNATSSLNSAITSSQTAINANTDSRVNAASSSIAAVVNANTDSRVNTASSSLASVINANTDTRVTAASSSLGATIASASSSLASTINTNTNTVVQAASSSLGTTLASITSSIAAIPGNVWASGSRTLTSFGTLAADVWTNGTRTLTGASLSSGSLALQSDVTTASSSLGAAITASQNAVNANTDTRVGIASSSLAAVINANTASVVQAASSSLGLTLGSITSSITALPTAIWNVATTTMTTPGSIGRVLATNIDTILSTIGGGSLTVADIWSYSARTLTSAALNSGSLATLTDINTATSSINATVTAASSSLASSLATKATLVNQQAGWTVRQSDFGSVLAGSTYRTKVTVLNYLSAPATPNATPTITVYDSSRNVVVSNVAMTALSTGVYEYTYTVPTSGAQGEWEAVVSTQVESGKTLTTNDYFEVAGSPAQVLIQSMGSVTTPNITANVRITNEGSADYEYQYEWCVVSDINNPCGGGNDTYYASAAKLIASGADFDTILSATVPAEGIYYFKLVVYFGTESSGASRQFTTTNYVPPQQGSGGTRGGGGGGGGGSSSSDSGESCGPADINCDKKVSAIDFSIMLAYWKTMAPFLNPRVDLNGDRTVNAVDFSILLYHWGKRY